MTSRLYQECLSCEEYTCTGCHIINEVVKARMDDILNTGGSTPSQYGLPEGSSDLQDLIEHRSMGFALGNIFKACYRYGCKNDNLYELNKMKWFIDRLIAEEERDNG